MGGEFIWPTVAETKEYRLKCKNLINSIIDRTPLELPVTPESPWVFILEKKIIYFSKNSH
jgi:hypothetical protein